MIQLTRKEEINQATDAYIMDEWRQLKHNVGDTFKAGIRWADHHPTALMAWRLASLVDGYRSGLYEGMTLQEVIDKYYD